MLGNPHTPTPLSTWSDSNAAAIVTPEGEMPDALCGIPMEDSDNPLGNDRSGWEALAERAYVDEPDFCSPSHLKHAAGAVLIEPDGRVWIVARAMGSAVTKQPFQKAASIRD